MGLFDFVKNQFIEVIEATDFQQDRIVFEFPVAGHEIKMGAQLIVREGSARFSSTRVPLPTCSARAITPFPPRICRCSPS